MLGHRLLTVLLLSLALPACARHSPQSAADASQARTVVRVINQSLYDMDIYMVREAGDRIRLGSVNSSRTADLTIPQGLIFGVSLVRFVARPFLGRGAEVSQNITVTAGDTVKLTILR